MKIRFLLFFTLIGLASQAQINRRIPANFFDTLKLSVLTKTDTSVYKPLAIDAGGKVQKLDRWPGSGGGGGGSYTLPIATATTLGGVKQGSGVTINPTTGVLSAAFVSSVGLSSSDMIITGSPITNSGTITANLNTTGVTAGTFTFATFTVDAKGRILSASSGATANTSTSGILSSTDWNTFNNKVGTTRAVNTSGSLTGGGNLSADRTLSLVNDNATPGNSKYYGTNSSGTKGFYDLPNITSSILYYEDSANYTSTNLGSVVLTSVPISTYRVFEVVITVVTTDNDNNQGGVQVRRAAFDRRGGSVRQIGSTQTPYADFTESNTNVGPTMTATATGVDISVVPGNVTSSKKVKVFIEVLPVISGLAG